MTSFLDSATLVAHLDPIPSRPGGGLGQEMRLVALSVMKNNAGVVPTDKDLMYPLILLRGILAHGFYFLSSFAFLTTGTLLGLVLSPFPRVRERWLDHIVHRFTRLLTARILPFFGIAETVEVMGAGFRGNDPPRIYVSNHRSYYDTPLLLSLLPGVRVLLKTGYRNTLVQRVFRHFLDYVYVDTSSLESIQQARNDCKTLLASGHSILIYPEGSRAPGRRLGEFKHLAFSLAKETGAPLVPLVIHHSPHFLSKITGSFFPRHKVCSRVRFLSCEDATGNPKELAASIHRRIARELKVLDAEFPP